MLIAHKRFFKFHMKHSEKSHCFKAFRKQIKLYALLLSKYKIFLRLF